MELQDLPVVDPRVTMRAERDDLIDLLAGLDDEGWLAPTESGHWRVKEVALHLLEGELRWLSRSRDGDRSSLIPSDGDYRDFVAALDALNERWVVGAGGLSRRVVVDLLRFSGVEADAHLATVDVREPSGVIWASTGPVPRWFDLCREMTEQWVHQQHIRDAVGQPGDHARFLPEVLATFVWAFPHQYRAEAEDGTTVEVALGTGGTWHLVRSSARWTLERGPASDPAASLEMPETQAWRQLTGLTVADGAITTSGPDHLVRPLLDVRGIIA